MPPYHIELTRQAYQALNALQKSSPKIAERVQNIIDSLAKNPSLGVPLKGVLKGLYKYRVGSYRIIYQIYHSQLLVIVLDIGHRREVYR